MTHRRDQKASAKMKTLSIESVDSPPSIVFKKMPPIDVDYLSVNWTNSSHLVVLAKSKVAKRRSLQELGICHSFKNRDTRRFVFVPAY